ncbi:ATP synthase F1 subunit gamma [uncultured Duncaniella sp.]|uniref:ATP synthase F1 subunit gamma n=1 Tax=uncultured Duncaniella sp. TaxID=2768039 RepID=UPI0025D62681|nr:ATP synthase F1 subunit gamma [uncultured Duncaniella sp.]
MATLRELKGRIGSVASSEKITGAMKMISSAKMHRAESDLRRLLPFRQQIENIIGNLLSADAEFSSPLTDEREVNSIAVMVLGSDDGLCGAYNINIFKELLATVKAYREKFGASVRITVLPVGAKMVKATSRMALPGVKVEVPAGIDSKSNGEAVKALTRRLEERFIAGDFDRVELLYMNFQSVSRQRVKCDPLLPVSSTMFAGEGVKASCRPYIFEPDAATIFVSVLPMFLLAVMQEVFTENRASEQAARIMAMQSANDNAKKLLEQLRLEYNKLRQQSITTELLDIVGGQVKND